jgi:hypothetical protein
LSVRRGQGLGDQFCVSIAALHGVKSTAGPRGFALDGEITMSKWPEIGALKVPLRFL